MHGLNSDIVKAKEFEEANKPDSLVKRKLNRIFGAATEVKTMFFTGFKMGACVGGIFGGLMGSYYAITTRTFMYIPMVAMGSGASFGFFMGIGMVIRTEMEGKEDETLNEHTGIMMR
jgi:hypothetical protein